MKEWGTYYEERLQSGRDLLDTKIKGWGILDRKVKEWGMAYQRKRLNSEGVLERKVKEWVGDLLEIM